MHIYCCTSLKYLAQTDGVLMLGNVWKWSFLSHMVGQYIYIYIYSIEMGFSGHGLGWQRVRNARINPQILVYLDIGGWGRGDSRHFNSKRP